MTQALSITTFRYVPRDLRREARGSGGRAAPGCAQSNRARSPATRRRSVRLECRRPRPLRPARMHRQFPHDAWPMWRAQSTSLRDLAARPMLSFGQLVGRGFSPGMDQAQAGTDAAPNSCWPPSRAARSHRGEDLSGRGCAGRVSVHSPPRRRHRRSRWSAIAGARDAWAHGRVHFTGRLRWRSRRHRAEGRSDRRHVVRW